MMIVIEENAKFPGAYQVRVDWDRDTSEIVGFSPYTLPKAMEMAKKCLEIVSRRGEESCSLRDVLEIDREYALKDPEVQKWAERRLN